MVGVLKRADCADIVLKQNSKIFRRSVRKIRRDCTSKLCLLLLTLRLYLADGSYQSAKVADPGGRQQ